MDDLSFAYTFTRSGKIRTGLTVAEFLLADEGPGDGGFAIVVGSHKANLPMPRSLSLMADHTHAVTEVCGKAGDCIVFTETCSHGTLPWRGMHQRRALLYKFSPGHASFGTGPHSIEYPPWIRSMKPEQAAVMIAPYGAGARKELPAKPKL
jgi:ectoine hydroxylase-related dioxygenase (phytanoyl-CoA dioxygenase family)